MPKLTSSGSDSYASSAPGYQSAGLRTNQAANPSLENQEVDCLSKPTQVGSVYGGDESTTAFPETTTSSTVHWSTSLQTVLDQPPSALPRQLILGGLAFCIAFVGWAWFGKIEEVGHAQGQLIPKGDVYKINPIDPGKIATIAVKEGQEVKAGQVLVALDTTVAAGEVVRLRQALAADKGELTERQALIEKARLEAQTRNRISAAEQQVQAMTIAQAKTNATTTQAMIAQLRTDAAAQRAQLAELKPLAGTDRELLAQLRQDAAANKARVARLKALVKQGAISRDYLFEIEQAARDRQSMVTKGLVGEGMAARNRLFEVKQALGDRQTTLVKNQGELQQALAEAERLRAGLAQKQAEGESAQLQAVQQTQQLEVEANRLKAKIAQTQTLLASTQAKLKQGVLTSPVDGVVSALNVPNKGEVVQTGQTIAEVAPHNAPLVLSAILPNREAGFIKVGMPVQIKLDAYPYQDYGIVPGVVGSISPDAQPDKQLGPVYKVEVALAHNSISTNDQIIPLKAGQTASAEIIIHRRRIADILLDPFKQLQKGGINL
ncbi:HlyD family secretion protein [uncultured Synechococcales cyanobacterium]|uniref:HlyD family secretion protein n=1 Tax=uncultured Synechococcales cyanobacterium TaxID=1936017 RepID=A0A6J4VW19_9CYAN|nr:HlyD family secretion protein [uncultured Synechococcales cyanobacterium]